MTRRWLLRAWLTVAAAFADPLPAEKIRQIEQILSSEMSRQSIPGMSIAVGIGEEIWTNGYGLSDLENFVPAKASTQYRTASIAKPMTAVAVMQLAEQGKIDLDAAVNRYVPSFPKKAYVVTARQLLAHLGGVRHYRPDEPDNTRYFSSTTEALKVFQDDDLVAEPGTTYSYTTYGYVLLGAMVESASGMTYLDYMEARVFRPAGMAWTMADDVYRIIPNRTRGYSRSADGRVTNAPLHDTSVKIPGGGLLSTAADLVRFAQALNSGKLLKGVTLEEMYTPQRTREGKPTGYGLGWGVGTRGGRKRYSHSGGQAGTSTYLVNLPEARTVIALMFNLQGAEAAGVMERILDVVLPNGQ